jgi:ABC-type transport system involved in cytochrome bd biosynthesis fused ATPase/permease subunit
LLDGWKSAMVMLVRVALSLMLMAWVAGMCKLGLQKAKMLFAALLATMRSEAQKLATA